MPNNASRLFNLIANGAEIIKAKDVGYLVIAKKQRQTRKPKEEKK